MEQNKPLKPLPQDLRKGELYTMYNKMGTETIRKAINGLIEDFKKQTSLPVGSKYIPRSVWIEWIRVFGFPKNYEPKPEWLEEKTVFDNL